MRDGGATRGLCEANRQLLLASELTYDRERAAALATLAHEVGELDEVGVDPATLAGIENRLDALASDAHEEVEAAVRRASRLLCSCRMELTP